MATPFWMICIRRASSCGAAGTANIRYEHVLIVVETVHRLRMVGCRRPRWPVYRHAGVTDTGIVSGASRKEGPRREPWPRRWGSADAFRVVGRIRPISHPARADPRADALKPSVPPVNVTRSAATCGT